MSHIDYMRYAADYAGSRAKNRFKFEIFWGLDKLLSEMKKGKDFHMIFDYVCDIEIHFSDHFEFYQIKTTKAKSYTLNKMTKIDKGKKNSVIGTLYKIRETDINDNSNRAKLAIVSNVGLSDKLAQNSPNFEFAIKDMCEKNKNKLLTTLQQEFDEEEIDLDAIYFIMTDLALSNYKDTMIGRVSNFYKDQYNDDVLKPSALLNVISEEIQQKADYELSCNSYEDLLDKKGISTDRIKFIFNRYAEKSASLIDKCKSFINEAGLSFNKKLAYYQTISTIVFKITENEFLRQLIMKIKDDIVLKMDNPDNETLFEGSLFKISKEFVVNTDISFPVELNIREKEILTLIALMSLEEETW